VNAPIKYSNVENIKLRSSILSIKSDAQQQMVEYDFGHRYHDLNYFEAEVFLYSLNSFST
jgi:hypothetical protein